MGGTDEAPGGRLLVVLGVEDEAGAEAAADGAVHDRQLPVLPVVDLRAADEDGGTGGHRADPDIVLMAQTAEILLQREEPVRGIRGGGRVVVVLLGESLGLELGGSVDTRQDGAGRRHEKGEDKLPEIH